MKSVVVSGYYGFGNLGDEAVLAGMVSTFRELSPGANLTIFSARPEQTQAQHRVRAIPRADFRAIVSALRTCDLFISGGGGLLQDTTSQRSLLYYLGLLYLAQRCGGACLQGHARRRGCKTMIMGQGIGPLRRSTSRWLARKVAARTDAITVRDEQSASLLREIAPNCPRAEVTADLAFAMPLSTHPHTHTPTHSSGVDAGGANRTLGVSLRPWAGQERWLPEVVSALDILSRQDGIDPVFIPLSPPSDRELIDSLRPHFRSSGAYAGSGPRRAAENVPRGTISISVLDNAIKCRDNLNRPEEAAEAIGGTRVLLGMRLHSLIFAAMTGVPFVALAYDPKVYAFAEQAGMPCLPLEKVKAEDIVAEVRALLPNRQREGQRLLAWAQEKRNDARRNVELAVSLLQD